MYKLTILDLDLRVLEYSGNPFTDTLPRLVSILGEILSSVQSYGTIISSVNAVGAYARACSDQFGLDCIAIITRAAE